MSQSETESKSTASESELKVVGYDDKDKKPSFILKSPIGRILKISGTFAEILSTLATSPTAQYVFFFDA